MKIVVPAFFTIGNIDYIYLLIKTLTSKFKTMPKFAYDKQDSVLYQFQKDIRQSESGYNATEQCISQKLQLPEQEKPRISLYNPNNPLNGSSSWKPEQWEIYNLTHPKPSRKK